jgi:hypothetical protein
MAKKITNIEFLEIVNNKFNFFYTYSEEYQGSSKYIKIICPKHGEFLCNAGHHLAGHGCQICGGNLRKTTKQFISDADFVHDRKYEYPDEYLGAHKKIRIICPEHGEFFQKPNSHLNGHGCQKCGKCYRRTHEEYVNECNIVHENKFKYISEFVCLNDKIKIECPIHGIFEQRAGDHLRGYGCDKCGGTCEKTNQEFLEEAKEKHGDKYYYPEEYKGSTVKIKIVCPDHGPFYQSPSHHTRGEGCSQCSRPVFDTESFLTESKKVHGDKYEYPDEYVGSKIRIRIICPEHGEFFQTPNAHTQGSGCQKCYGNQLKTTPEFIEDAIEEHGEVYSYISATYINSKTSLMIICKKHGPFWQVPSDHLDGCGCPTCNMSQGERKILKILTKHNINNDPQYKFKDCKNIYPLRFDFGILNNSEKLLGLVEYHGEQHYIPTDFTKKLTLFEMEEELKERQARDQIKKTYCETNKIPLLCIPYFEKFPESMLIDFLKNTLNIEFKNDPTCLNVREYYPESFLKPFPKCPSKDPNKSSKSSLTVHIKDATIVLEETE